MKKLKAVLIGAIIASIIFGAFMFICYGTGRLIHASRLDFIFFFNDFDFIDYTVNGLMSLLLLMIVVTLIIGCYQIGKEILP